MNINTSTLLNLLSSNTKLDSQTKQSLEKLSVDGKIDLSSALKEKSVQTLLSGLFKDILSGAKSKSSISEALQNNKGVFDFKNLSSELKNLSTLIESNPKLQKQSAVLKEFLVNIKNLNENVLKNNISNSGVFLESKLSDNQPAKQNLPYNVKASIVQIMQTIDEVLNDATKIKFAVKNLLANNIANLTTNTPNNLSSASNISSTTNTLNISDISNQLKSLLNLIQSNPKLKTQNIELNQIIKDIKNIDNNSIKSLKPEILNNIVKQIDNIITVLQPQAIQAQQVQNKTIITNLTNQNEPLPIAQKIKLAVNKLLLSNIKEIPNDIKNLTNQIQSNPKLQQQSNVLKDIFTNIKNTDLNNIRINILNNLELQIDDVINNAKDTKATLQNTTTSDIKNSSQELKNILTQIQLNPKLSKQTAVIKDFLSNINNLVQNQTTNQSTAISNDIKAAVLQIQEQIDGKMLDLPKEVKVQVDKILTQIEFYQLSSYSSVSNHTYLPALWDNIEDADIKFNSDKKDNYSCQINLTLAQYGELKVLLLLDNKNNLNINIGTQKQELKEKIQENLIKLRKGINNIGLILESLNIFDLEEKNVKPYEQKAYGSDNLSFGLDIKA